MITLSFRKQCIERTVLSGGVLNTDDDKHTTDGVREETSAHILCECEALASLRHAHLGSFFLEPEDIRITGLGAIWTYSRATGLP